MLPRPDQSIHCAQIDAEVFEDLFGRQKGLVGRKFEGHGFLGLALFLILHGPPHAYGLNRTV